ncbi:MAG: SulP family inorganic anion transporter [Burkholderiaceae bacterium]|nr:SulP family inorganic anion transporter [Burkholderiaceae bacterium]
MIPRSLALRALPALRWWPRVNAATLSADALAGAVGAFLVLPQGLAYATLAGLPPEHGLYAAIVPTIVAALFGSSLHTVTGPTNALALMTFAALAPLAVAGSPEYLSLAAMLAVLSGACMLVLGVLRLGLLVNFISQPVIVGFTAGAGLLILVSQVGALTGAPVPARAAASDALLAVFAHPAQWRPAVLAVACVTVVTGVFVRRWRPRWPGVVIAMLAGSALAHALRLAFGAAVPMLDAVPRTPPPFALPGGGIEGVRELSGVAVAVAIVSLTQSISMARALALRTGQRIDGNQEFIGQGLANLAAGLFSAFPVGASANRSGPNLDAGAATPMSAVFAGLFLAAIVLLFAPWVAWLPEPAVAGVLVLASLSLIDVARIRSTLRISRPEGIVLLSTLVATLLMRLEVAVLVGTAMSLVVYLNRTSRPTIRSLVPDPRSSERPFAPVDASLRECPQAKLLSIEGSIYFGAVSHVESHFETLREVAREQKHLLLLMRNVNFVDVAGVELLVAEARRRREMGGALYLCGLRPQVRAFLERGDAIAQIGADRIYEAKHTAIADIFSRLDPEICRRCTARIFYECQQYNES